MYVLYYAGTLRSPTGDSISKNLRISWKSYFVIIELWETYFYWWKNRNFFLSASFVGEGEGELSFLNMFYCCLWLRSPGCFPSLEYLSSYIRIRVVFIFSFHDLHYHFILKYRFQLRPFEAKFETTFFRKRFWLLGVL